MNKRTLQIFGLSLLLLTPSMGNIKMIKDHNGKTPKSNNPPCLLTCAGSTGTTTWTGEAGRLTTTVDIRECGFSETPIVTTSINFGDDEIYMPMIGMSSPWKILLGRAQPVIPPNLYCCLTTLKPGVLR